MKRIGIAIALFLLAFVGWQRFGSHDAFFESSDGAWVDRTWKFKGRNFRSVLWNLEAYRLQQNKEQVTLVRITPTSCWMFLWSPQEKADPMWKVPTGPSHGLPRYFGGVRGDMAEISRRADAAFMFWKQK
jgi:hypothetical protein